jgi:hypothetical protein
MPKIRNPLNEADMYIVDNEPKDLLMFDDGNLIYDDVEGDNEMYSGFAYFSISPKVINVPD